MAAMIVDSMRCSAQASCRTQNAAPAALQYTPLPLGRCLRRQSTVEQPLRTPKICRRPGSLMVSATSTSGAAAVPAQPRRPEYIPNRIDDPNYVRIFDTTLRDGEQSPGATLTSKEKLDIARQLAKLGVDIIEAGFPVASPDDFDAVRSIAMDVGNNVDEDGYVPVICGLSRTIIRCDRRAVFCPNLRHEQLLNNNDLVSNKCRCLIMPGGQQQTLKYSNWKGNNCAGTWRLLGKQ